jgi:hypothetical protein
MFDRRSNCSSVNVSFPYDTVVCSSTGADSLALGSICSCISFDSLPQLSLQLEDSRFATGAFRLLHLHHPSQSHGCLTRCLLSSITGFSFSIGFSLCFFDLAPG